MLLRLFFAIGLVFAPIPSAAVQAQAAGSVSAPELASGQRVRLNFNRDWRYRFGDVEGAQASGFDDSGWERVGLPHSFSIPYFRSPSFPVGDGWYRKHLVLPKLPAGRRLFLEFEGAFQDAEIFINGKALARHRGGYTGFPVDITGAVREGDNVVAVRVNNRWSPTLAPRAGEHVFSGGLYRDVWLVATDAVHVPWTGTFVTTPELSEASGRVSVETEVRNEEGRALNVTARSEVLDPSGHRVKTLPKWTGTIQPGETVTARQLSAPLAKPLLWSPETPHLYRVRTRLIVDGKERDRFETEFGFRWFSWTANQGFFLNGKHRYFKGANVHQDQAGWGDAVTNGAIERDVRLMKEAGLDFIRGSHYPHDPHFAKATDRIGMLFMSEAPFWGTAWFNNDWSSSAYPTDPAHRAEFDASVKQQLAEMIRINRNSPSIIAWSMDNEVFFTAEETMGEVRRLLREQVELTHRLDPTRPASVSGAQRGEIDKIGDIAGYNGDGAALFPDPGIPNFVAEYGSTMADRPGDYSPGWGDLPNTPGARQGEAGSWRFPWRSGEAIWVGFDHGSIAGRKFGGMGLIDYFRLPKRQWYWYRNEYRGISPEPWPQEGKPAALRLTASQNTIARADGTDDVQIIVTVLDKNGIPIANNPPVRLTIEAGPGEFPTGRTIDFAPDSDIEIREGLAAIAMRSWFRGKSRVRATSPGLEDAVLEVATLEGPEFVPGVSPLSAARPYRSPDRPSPRDLVQTFGLRNPTAASSALSGHSPLLANDGDMTSYWAPAAHDTDPWFVIDVERVIVPQRIMIRFHGSGSPAFVVEAQDKGQWRPVAQAEGSAEADRDIQIEPLTSSRFRIRPVGGGTTGIVNVEIVGAIQL
jgi:hypothetical protein